MSTTRGRLVVNNQVVFDQADFFQIDGFTRVTGLVPAQLLSQIFFQNAFQPWLFVSGVGVTDAQVASGKIYWTEIPGSPGVYSIRWRPNAVGYWRLLVTYPAGTQVMGQDYDVTVAGVPVETGLKASFVKSNC